MLFLFVSCGTTTKTKYVVVEKGSPDHKAVVAAEKASVKEALAIDPYFRSIIDSINPSRR